MNATRLAVRALTVSILLVGMPVVLSGPASAADSPGCVTKREFRQVHGGMARARVHEIFDTSGKSLFENAGVVHNSAREYRMCAAWKRATGDSKVQVQYNNYATHGGPQRVVHKQHY